MKNPDTTPTAGTPLPTRIDQVRVVRTRTAQVSNAPRQLWLLWASSCSPPLITHRPSPPLNPKRLSLALFARRCAQRPKTIRSARSASRFRNLN
jgi:hypothetical protein